MDTSAWGPILRKVKAIFLSALLAALVAFGAALTDNPELLGVNLYGLPIGMIIAGLVAMFVTESREKLAAYMAAEPTPEIE